LAKILVGKVSDVPEGKIKQFTLPNSEVVALANVGGKMYVIQGHCGHQGGPLGEGELENNVVTCPWHGAKWDVTTGKLVDFAIDLDPIKSYAVSMEGENVFVEG
jgi:3-phenylpropionate/trans-cinnamate dioxygenase ferredoxin component